MSSTPLDKRPTYTPLLNTNKITRTENGYSVGQTTLKRYYSEIDAEIYFGNEYVEDIDYIEWSINESTIPLFGYNSYTYDEIAKGSRIINGSFTINFTSPNYLFQIIQSAQNVENLITNMKSYMIEDNSRDKTYINTSLNGIGISGTNSAPIYDYTFDIDIMYGQNSEYGSPCHVILKGVTLLGCNTKVGAYGGPVKEAYSFIAKDIITDGGSYGEENAAKVNNTITNTTNSAEYDPENEANIVYRGVNSSGSVDPTESPKNYYTTGDPIIDEQLKDFDEIVNSWKR